MPQTVDTLIGKTIRWRFNDGPTAGKTFEHDFNDDGTIAFKVVEALPNDSKVSLARKCAVLHISQDVHVVSYLGDSGYTLTAVLHFHDMSVIAFASNEKEWFQQQGTFEVVN